MRRTSALATSFLHFSTLTSRFPTLVRPPPHTKAYGYGKHPEQGRDCTAKCTAARHFPRSAKASAAEERRAASAVYVPKGLHTALTPAGRPNKPAAAVKPVAASAVAASEAQRTGAAETTSASPLHARVKREQSDSAREMPLSKKALMLLVSAERTQLDTLAAKARQQSDPAAAPPLPPPSRHHVDETGAATRAEAGAGDGDVAQMSAGAGQGHGSLTTGSDRALGAVSAFGAPPAAFPTAAAPDAVGGSMALDADAGVLPPMRLPTAPQMLPLRALPRRREMLPPRSPPATVVHWRPCHCGAPGMYRCGACQLAVYCCQDCQDRDWPTHARQCRTNVRLLAEIRAGTIGGRAEQEHQYKREYPADSLLAVAARVRRETRTADTRGSRDTALHWAASPATQAPALAGSSRFASMALATADDDIDRLRSGLQPTERPVRSSGAGRRGCCCYTGEW